MRRLLILPAMALIAGGLTNAVAQDEMSDQAAATPAPETATPKTWSPTWSDQGIAKVAQTLTGSWKTSTAVGDTTGDGESNIVMTVAPVPVEGVADALYVETARADRLWEPYRQAIFQLYRYKGKIRLRTYEFMTSAESRKVYAGLGAAPELFPSVSRDDLIATLDVELEPKGDGYTGKTPYPYPTGVGGAIEMTSEITLTQNAFTTADRGFDAQGNIVWGAGAGSAYTFERVPGLLKADHRARGVVVIDFLNPGEDTLQAGDRVHVHYIGWTGEGYKFDASRDRNRPFIFPYPSPPGRMIEGWDVGLEGISVGAHRKVYLPWDVAYGERGNPAANIPPKSDLIFDLECLLLEHPEAETSNDQGGGDNGAGGGATTPDD
ncbi:MAG: CpcT/CpeT family chromophore lyase [Phycisphaerales bacterium]